MRVSKKILFFVTEDWYFISHRIKMAEYLVNKGFDVHVCCKDTGKASQIKKKNINWHNLNINRKSVSLFQYFYEVFLYVKYSRKIKPDIIHFFSMRPILTGFLASLLIKSNFLATFTGMGFIFIKKGVKGFILRKLILIFLKITLLIKKITLIVQNEDDRKFILEHFIFLKEKVKIIRGSGIDIRKYKFTPEPKSKKITLGFAGRLLQDKGIDCLIQSFIQAKKSVNNLNLLLAGPLDLNNPTGISEKKLNEFLRIRGIYYLGNLEDITSLWKKSNIAILLSKREGLPLSLMEAAALGRAIIATDVPGCREIALEGYNAITVFPNDVKATTKAIIKLSKNKNLREKYAINSRKLVESDLKLEHICKQHYKLYSNY